MPSRQEILAGIPKLAARVQELVAQGLPATLAVERTWAEFNVPRMLYDLARIGALKELSLGLDMGSSEAAAKAWSQLMPDGQLRQWLAKASANLRLNLEREITTSLQQGESVRQAAVRLGDAARQNPDQLRKDLQAVLKGTGPQVARRAEDLIAKLKAQGFKDQNLWADYRRVADAVLKGASPEAIAKQVRYTVQTKTRQLAERVVRTETERAMYAAATERIAQDPHVKLVRIQLASDHVVRDICDAVAKADCGYGPGVYPLNKAPILPLHPNCGCYIRPVYLPKGTLQETPEAALAQAKEANGVKGPVQYQTITPKTER